jgi:hypothetical protein
MLWTWTICLANGLRPSQKSRGASVAARDYAPNIVAVSGMWQLDSVMVWISFESSGEKQI